MRSCSRFGGRAVLAVALVMLALGVMAASAGAAPGRPDAAATKAFIASAERYDAGEIKRIPAITAREAAFVARESSVCPGVLAGTPTHLSSTQDLALTEFGTEVGAALEIDALQPVRGLTERIGALQERLRFSDPVLRWRVGVDASATTAYLAIRLPDLCADARALAASQYTKLTPAGERFAQDALGVLGPASAPPEGLLRQMRAYAPGPVAAALKRLPVLQRRFDQTLQLRRHANAILNAVFGVGTKLERDALAERVVQRQR
jgi:hypothetical protein